MQSWQNYLMAACLIFIGSFTSPLYSETTTQALFTMEEGDFLILRTNKAGMFANFAALLAALEIYDTSSFAGLLVDSRVGEYLEVEKGHHWWNYFFEPLTQPTVDRSTKRYLFSQDEFDILAVSSFAIPRNRLAELVQKYIHIKPAIQQEVDMVVANHFQDHFVIGVHHRGTDKITEMGIIPYEMTYHTLLNSIEKLSSYDKSTLKIYVATDDQHFLQYMQAKFPQQVIYSLAKRSEGQEALHSEKTIYSNYLKGKEALIDCLLLAKCQLLLRPWSNLSCTASYFNPQLPVIILTHPKHLVTLMHNFKYASEHILPLFSKRTYAPTYQDLQSTTVQMPL